MYYFEELIDKTKCLGNTLSTINYDLSSLDSNLYSLSSDYEDFVIFTETRFEAVSSEISSLYGELTSLSSEVYDGFADLETQIDTLSANTVYFTRNTLSHDLSGNIEYDFGLNGPHVYYIFTDGDQRHFNNISDMTSMEDGQFGKIIIEPQFGGSISSWGGDWKFSNDASAFSHPTGGMDIVDFYKQGAYLYASVKRFF